jgi:hypothetical protein
LLNLKVVEKDLTEYIGQPVFQSQRLCVARVAHTVLVG